MKFNDRIIYCLQALKYLKDRPNCFTRTVEISRAFGISRRYLQTILRLLSQHGLIEGKSGLDGGFKIVDKNISVASVVHAIEGFKYPKFSDAIVCDVLEEKITDAITMFYKRLTKIKI